MPVLAEAALDERERALLRRLVGARREGYGDDLFAVWLYGSRARGERTHDESDVDVLVITRGERSDERLIPLSWRCSTSSASAASPSTSASAPSPGWRTVAGSTRSSCATWTATRSSSTESREPAVG